MSFFVAVNCSSLGFETCSRGRVGALEQHRCPIPVATPFPEGRDSLPAASGEGPVASSAGLGRFWVSELTLGSGCKALKPGCELGSCTCGGSACGAPCPYEAINVHVAMCLSSNHKHQFNANKGPETQKVEGLTRATL